MLCGVSLRFHWYNKLVLYLIGVKVLKFSFSNLYQNSRNRHSLYLIRDYDWFKTLYLKLLRLVPLFKSESEAKLLENVRFSQFAFSLILSEINPK